MIILLAINSQAITQAMLSGVSCRKPPLRNRRSPKTNGAKPRFLARSALESLKTSGGPPGGPRWRG